MKKVLIRSICVLAFGILSQITHAQEKVWSLGPEVGVNLSKYGMDANANSRVSGINAGIFVTYSVINTFAITGKVLYSEKGASFGSHEELLKYIEIPIIGRFFFNKRGRFRPNFLLGPSFGSLRSVSIRTGTNDPVRLPDYKSTYNAYDLGVTGGLGLNYLIFRHTRLLLDARYIYGLMDLTKAPGQINNETIAVSFGMSFGI